MLVCAIVVCGCVVALICLWCDDAWFVVVFVFVVDDGGVYGFMCGMRVVYVVC